MRLDKSALMICTVSNCCSLGLHCRMHVLQSRSSLGFLRGDIMPTVDEECS